MVVELSILARLWHRWYSDFLMPSRLNEYKSLLEDALTRGYEILSVARFWELARADNIAPELKYLVLRHDIDTDSVTARRMWAITKELGVTASFYFRLSTIDCDLMDEIAQAGCEASYHYEELATVSKREGLKTQAQLNEAMPRIQNLFRSNLVWLRRESHLPINVVAAHGDFVNRSLGVANWVMLADQEFRHEVGIALEVYDEAFMRHVKGRYSDTHYPLFWRPHSPIEALQREERVIYLLVHPRHWNRNVKANLLDDLNRIREGIVYRVRKGVHT